MADNKHGGERGEKSSGGGKVAACQLGERQRVVRIDKFL